MASPANKGYLSGLTSFSPWSSKPATPEPKPLGKEAEKLGVAPPLTRQSRNADHTVSHRHRLSLRNYPRDCPPVGVLWYHAVDVPKRKLNHPPEEKRNAPAGPQKAPILPKKYVPFSAGDSRAIETAFQRLAEDEDTDGKNKIGKVTEDSSADITDGPQGDESRLNRSEVELDPARVPVNEDYLFDVDIRRRELAPAYWLGPVYDVRRGTWFLQDGSTLKPCDENLATQLEEGYLKIRPWTFDTNPKAQAPTSQPKARPVSAQFDGRSDLVKAELAKLTPKSSAESLKTGNMDVSPATHPQKTFRLFGSHMNSVVTYQDANTAWLVNDDFLTSVSSTLYERFAGGGHFAGIRVRRGFADLKKAEAKKAPVTAGVPQPGTTPGLKSVQDQGKDVVEPPSTTEALIEKIPESETIRKSLQRQMSSLLEAGGTKDPEQQDEEERQRDEQQMLDDYQDDGTEQGREIDHLLLVTHGIGQRLGLKLESVNFVHDVNTLRKSLKAVYAESETLQALNDEVQTTVKNSRIQVLPICWRHLLDFPKQSLKHNRREHDLGDLDFEDDEYPKLEDITLEGSPAVRNLIADLGLDILLYHSPAYKGHITRIVLQECNRIYKLFKLRNPNFNGKVSLVGHSLGSAIMFDILCNERVKTAHHRKRSDVAGGKTQQGLQLDFEVEDFYALGSPTGLFQMLKGRRIAARHTPNLKPAQTPFTSMDDPFSGSSGTADSEAQQRASAYIEITTSSPKCGQVFNIFHPADPIAYRIEPLISPAMAALKPQPLPYTKRGIFTAPAGQAFTGIGSRVGQSVSGLWTSLSSGIATSLLNRSLGLTAEESLRQGNKQNQSQQSTIPRTSTVPLGPVSTQQALQQQQQAGALTKNPSIPPEEETNRPPILNTNASTQSIETLYSGFRKRRLSQVDTEGDPEEVKAELANAVKEVEEQARRLRREARKVRDLNRTGRVDFGIQEGAFDISLLASIASHLSYWADEDVSHFMLSQLLATQREKPVDPLPDAVLGTDWAEDRTRDLQ